MQPHNLPATFLNAVRNSAGFDESSFIKAHVENNPITSIRINPQKVSSINSLNFDDDNILPVSWSKYGYYLSQRPSFTLDPLFHAGAYYVQEAGSMFLHHALNSTVDLTTDIKILDLCAAPGGKSTLLQSVISDNSLLVSNEVIKTRVNILLENITKWGAENVVVTNNDPKDFQRLGGFFDVLVIDAPCSGSGLFRKDASAINEWSEANVALCSQRQQRILADALPALKDGGILVYSTCSYSQQENEAICDWLKENYAAESIKLEVDAHWGIVETISPQHKAFGYRFYPDKTKSEGFFLAVFRIPASGNGAVANTKSKAQMATKAEAVYAGEALHCAGNYEMIKSGDDILAISKNVFEDFKIIQANFFIKKAGVRVGVSSNKGIIPNHELAMSNIMANCYPKIDLDKESALNYLRKSDIEISNIAKGWALVQYEGIALGFIKVLHNRVNNYYPREWRIINK